MFDEAFSKCALEKYLKIDKVLILIIRSVEMAWERLDPFSIQVEE